MSKIQIALTLFVTGIIGHLIMRKSMDIGNAIRSLLFNQRGEGEAGGAVKFTPEQQAFFDKTLDARVGEIKAKYEPALKEIDDLKKFKTDFEKSQETKNQEDLVKAKKYEEAEGNLKKQIGDISTKLTAKDQEISNLRIEHALTNEISKQGGFNEEVLAMIKGQAKLNAAGQVVIPGKDANGVDIEMPVEAGIKKFLTERPHLVKASFKGGSGSGGEGTGGSTGGGGEDTLDTLNQKYAVAEKARDLKSMSEIKGKINTMLKSKQVSR